MVNKCVVFGCSNAPSDKISVFQCPNNSKIIWSRFVKRTRAKWNSKAIAICSEHFTKDDFENWMAFESGYHKKLALKKDAVPTIYPVKDTRVQFQREGLQAACSLGQTVSDIKVTTVRTAVRKREVARILSENKIPEMGNADVPTEQTDLTEQVGVSEQGDANQQSAGPTLAVNFAQQTEKCSVQKRSVKSQINIRVKTRSIGIQCALPVTARSKTLCPNITHATPDFNRSNSMSEDEISEDSDSSYCPTVTSNECSLQSSFHNTSKHHEEQKFIVYKSNLIRLFEKCNICGHSCLVSIGHQVGTYIKIIQNCPRCCSCQEWSSQPFVNKVPAGNLALSAAILFTGLSPTKVTRLFNAINIACHTVGTYHQHAKLYLHPAVWTFWMAHKMDLVEELHHLGRPLKLGGDGRADSPGHSAKYGSYTLMELNLNKVIDIELVQSNEVGGSYHMELEGLIRSLDYVEREGLEFSEFVSDRHVQIRKWMSDNHPEKDHWNDIWHVAKGVGKKIERVAKLKECEFVKPWKKSIMNHLYWVAKTSDGNGKLALAKWKSLPSHMQNIHTGHDDPLFPECNHPPLNCTSRRKRWLQPNTKACEKLQEVLINTRLLKDIEKLSPQYQTSGIEGFHSVITHFCPKSTGFSYKGMLIRLCLAAIHYNSNSNKQQSLTSDGELSYIIKFPKYKKGEYRVEPRKETANFGYVAELMHHLFTDVVYNPQNHTVALDAIDNPPYLCSDYVHPDKTEAIKGYVSRFK